MASAVLLTTVQPRVDHAPSSLKVTNHKIKHTYQIQADKFYHICLGLSKGNYLIQMMISNCERACS